MCVSACVRTLRISVSLHNKSLLNKCKADGTVVSPPCGEEEREKREGKRGGETHAYSNFSSSTDTLIGRITQTVTEPGCETLNPAGEVKGGI